MNPNHWERICCNVRDQMATHVWNFVTPISLPHGRDRGQALGTGSYLRLQAHVIF